MSYQFFDRNGIFGGFGAAPTGADIPLTTAGGKSTTVHVAPVGDGACGNYFGTQAMLKALGFDPGPIDGMAGKNTHAALKAWWEARMGTPYAGGPYPNQATCTALINAYQANLVQTPPELPPTTGLPTVQVTRPKGPLILIKRPPEAPPPAAPPGPPPSWWAQQTPPTKLAIVGGGALVVGAILWKAMGTTQSATPNARRRRRRTARKNGAKQKEALKSLLEYVTSGRRYESRNPYTLPEVKAAQKALRGATAQEKKALRNLLHFVTSGARYESRNPYAFAEVKAALRVADPHEFESIYGSTHERGARAAKRARGIHPQDAHAHEMRVRRTQDRWRRGIPNPAGCHDTVPAKYRRQIGRKLHRKARRSDFAFPECWGYPVFDAQHARAAASRFGTFGKRLPKSKRSKVARRIRKAEKRFHVGPFRGR